MQRNIVGDVIYYTFSSLNDTHAIIHAISSRHGGVSPSPYATLNLSHTTGDDERNVEINIRRLHNTLGLDSRATISARQAQAARIAIVGSQHLGTLIADVDALITNKPNVPLMLRYADCVPILLYDHSHHVIGLVHAGWRGTVGKIASQAVETMIDYFGTRTRDLIACIAPSIGPCCYRINNDVISIVRSSLDPSDDLLITFEDGVHFDLWRANARQLIRLGVERVEIAEICTAHHTDDFYSWRAEKTKTGRFGAIMSIRDS